ncbi:hypothetical protein CTI12_AA061080 [Artemisia annua]|uniref:Uncharacterized protein n=1 Tax=Artemisia annua TaxID=35608 RepID=A0A2U1Q861_ARTAN|nr:hypothetical protein CTI12_AA061080 [Artemisia annua]
MAASALLLVALKTVFSILACVMVAALAYGLFMDGFYSCLDPHASATICGYIALLLFKLSPEESLKDPIYFVLAKRGKRDDVGHTRGPSVITARVIFAALGCLMVGVVIYALVGDGFPFQTRIFTPCMITTTTDNYIHVVVFSVGLGNSGQKGQFQIRPKLGGQYWGVTQEKEEGSATICGYIALLLFKLSPEESLKDPIYFVLAKRGKRDDVGHTRGPSVITARVIFAALGCLMVGVVIYALVGDGFPFQTRIFTPCMITTTTDNYIHVVVFSVGLGNSGQKGQFQIRPKLGGQYWGVTQEKEEGRCG